MTRDGTDLSRRGFLGWITGILVALGVLVNAVPFAGALIGKPPGGKKEDFVAVGPVTGLKPGEPTNLTFTDVQQDAYIRETLTRNVWAVQQASGDLVVYSPICPHLGCQYSWDGAKKQFICPCHNSLWTVDGKRISGPSPRDLDTLSSKVEKGTLLVKWEQFRLATPDKVPIA